MTTRRDIEVATPTATTGSPGRKVIATIGIDRYQHWQRLANAVRDATRTAELFGQLGFEQLTAPLLDHDATGKAIQSLVTMDLKKLGPNDSLVLFYAGHGASYGHRPGGEEIKTGYLIPADASSSADEVSTWIDLEGWLRAVALLPAKHILVILDACRSGIALDGIVLRHRGDDAWQHETSAALQARRSRRIITSALGDQVALDSGPKHGHSLFTGCLLEGLTYDLRRLGNRTATGSGLGMYLQRRVDAHTRSQQTPDFGCFFHDDRGELVIPLVGQALEDSTEMPASAAQPLPQQRPPAGLPPRASPHSATELSMTRDPTAGVDEATRPEPRCEPLPLALRSSTSSPNDAAERAPSRERAPSVSVTSYPHRAPAEGALDDDELSQLVKRLEHAATAEAQRMTIRAMLGLLTWFIVSGISVPLERWDRSGALAERAAVGITAICGFVVLANLALRVIAPIGMRHVIEAVRDAPERVVLVRYHVTSTDLRYLLAAAGLTAVLLVLVSLVPVLFVLVFIVLAALITAVRVIAPAAMRSMLRTMRDAPRRVGSPRQPTARSRIEIRTAKHCLVVKAPDDGPALFEALTRRCATAMVGR
jgi:hypothetical protein